MQKGENCNLRATPLIEKSLGEMRLHCQGGVSHMAGSEQKPTRKQIRVLVNFSGEDLRETRGDWVGAECCEVEAALAWTGT